MYKLNKIAFWHMILHVICFKIKNIIKTHNQLFNSFKTYFIMPVSLSEEHHTSEVEARNARLGSEDWRDLGQEALDVVVQPVHLPCWLAQVVLVGQRCPYVQILHLTTWKETVTSRDIIEQHGTGADIKFEGPDIWS